MTVLDDSIEPLRKKRRTDDFLDNWISSSETINNSELRKIPSCPDAMVNGLGLSESYHQPLITRSTEENGYGESATSSPPTAPLHNIGNTCYLNSILYTLRFAPSFLHKLHHLNSNSAAFTKQILTNKMNLGYKYPFKKALTLGRPFDASIDTNGKDLITSYNANSTEIKSHTVIHKLHQVFTSLSMNELRDRMEPFQPNDFLHALRDVTSLFESNMQHDAHELLVSLIDIIREVCESLYEQTNLVETLNQPSFVSSAGKRVKLAFRKSLKMIGRNKKAGPRLRENHSEGDIKKYLINGDTSMRDEGNSSDVDDNYLTNQNTLFDDFQGVSLLRTTCVECEQVTERKENICDICVPINTDHVINCNDPNKLYQSIIVTEEYLVDINKYWCEKCCRLNEAKRCVKYEKLPRLLTLQLKRFEIRSTVVKINDYMPTPLTLACFCEECLQVEEANEQSNGEMMAENERPHCYSLYAIIAHKGSTPQSGHYLAYVKSTDSTTQEYLYCSRDKPKTSSLSRDYDANAMSTNNGVSSGTMSADKPTNRFNKICRKLSSKSFNGGSGVGYCTTAKELDQHVRTVCKGLDCCSVRMQCQSSVWLECDDEQIRVLETSELKELLRSKDNAATTPYLLFYARVDG